MATCLMDTGQFPNHYIKQINGYRWAVEELIKYTYQPLSLNKSKESKERNVIKSVYSHLITSQITYMFTVLNEQMENSSKKINKSLLTTGIMDTFIYNFLTCTNLDEDSMRKFCKVYIRFIITKTNRSYERKTKRCNSLSYFKNSLKCPKSSSS